MDGINDCILVVVTFIDKCKAKDVLLVEVEQKIKELIKGFMDSIPLSISASIYGLVYGVMACKAGLSIFDTVVMSLIVFAGASQMTAVQMIAMGSGMLSIIITVFIINLRHFLMAASISPYLKHESNKMKMVNSFFLTDESYAASYSYFQKGKATGLYFLGSGLSLYVFWSISGVIGYFFGNIISSQLNYIFDFAFVAAFIGMIVPMIKGAPVVVTVIASGVISIIGSQVLPGKWYIIIAGILGSLAGYMASELMSKNNEEDVLKEVMDCEH